ncbi:hypothetical protein MHBO_003096 [Bonamia ostreae]|uniref:CCR4-Not complex component Not1 C-terminal domain-containing protein n=1 Tax=Bonamia ostreae TaxID=126728 RepID=A0ABV2AQ74_9EUKA
MLSQNFPSFLSEFNFDLATALPPKCFQLRNVVLSAVPVGTNPILYRYNDPNSLLEPGPPAAPRWETVVTRFKGLKTALDQYLSLVATSAAAANAFLPEAYFEDLDLILCDRAKKTARGGDRDVKPNRSAAAKGRSGSRKEYNRRAICTLAAYFGDKGMSAMRRAMSSANAPTTNALDRIFLFFGHLLAAMEPQGRYLLVAALLNQLRYHSSHTHVFSLVVLQLYGNAPDCESREIIVRAMLERLAPNGPHPAGLVSVFVELVRNPFYNLNAHCFGGSNPSALYIFKSLVARFVPELSNEREIAAK